MSGLINALVGYKPDRDARKSLKETPKRKRTSDGGKPLPDNVRPNLRTKWLEQSLSEGDSLVWNNLKANGLDNGQSPLLNEQEIEYIQNEQADWEYLSRQKAEELKPYWAAGYSATNCAAAFRGKYGYGRSTIEKYWRVFNRYASPIE